MIVTYRPDGQREVRWDLKDVRLLMSEAEAIERVTGKDWSEVRTQQSLVIRDSPVAKRALTWVLLKRQEPQLRYRSFDPPEGSIKVRLDAEEAAEIRAGIEDEYGDDEDEYDRAMRQLDGITDPQALAEREGAPDDADTDEDEGKAEPEPAAHQAAAAEDLPQAGSAYAA